MTLCYTNYCEQGINQHYFEKNCILKNVLRRKTLYAKKIFYAKKWFTSKTIVCQKIFQKYVFLPQLLKQLIQHDYLA